MAVLPVEKVNEPVSDAAARVLDAAEKLFMEHGYAAVKLRDIAGQLSIKQASLYYHFPEGKEQLYVAVARRAFARYHNDMLAAVNAADATFSARLSALAHWFSQHNSMNFSAMLHVDLPAISAESQKLISASLFEYLFLPIQQLIQEGADAGEVHPFHAANVTGAFLSLMDGLRYGQMQGENAYGFTRTEMVNELVALLLNGLLPRK